MDYNQLKTVIERFGEMLEASRCNDQRLPLEQALLLVGCSLSV